ncbi:hypothetical protein H4S08_000050 [Coemansia sp. RSA 1365]|nr:hypothetical protein H4S08_000050 [Coemansia sp. RSA 1365]
MSDNHSTQKQQQQQEVTAIHSIAASKVPEQLPALADNKAEPVLLDLGCDSERDFQNPPATELLAENTVSTLSISPKYATNQTRRLSTEPSASVQVEHGSQHLVASPNPTSAYPIQRSVIKAELLGGSNINEDNEDNDSLLKSMSSTSLSRQAEFTFSASVHDSPSLETSHFATASTNAESPRYFPSRKSPTFTGSSSPAPSSTHQDLLAAGHRRRTPSQSQQIEEDIRMSESPRPEIAESSDRSTPAPSAYLSLAASSVSQRATQSSHGHIESDQQSSMGETESMTPPRMSLNQASPSLNNESDSDAARLQEGVSMPPRSALLYHAGYNSGRGAVWRFFKVVEARVSGNTDRAECLLCEKRMLGKSADMKKHIVGSCPNRREISEDMRPILEIVKAELENPKKRAKRNSTTPITIRSDGSFAPISSPFPAGHPDASPGSSTRMHGSASHTSLTPPRAHAHHQRSAPYDLHHHSDAHRSKVAKYSRDYMHRGSNSYYDGPGGSSDHPSQYAHGSSAMPMPPPSHAVRAPGTYSGMGPRMRSPVSGYTSRHAGHPMAPPIPQPVPTQPPRQSPLSHHSQLQQSSHAPSQQPQLQTRYYPPGHGSQHPASISQHPSQQAGLQRQGAPLPHHGIPPSQPLSQTPSPLIGSPGMQLSRLKSKLQRQIPAFGVWLTIPSPLTARALAAQGFDWACIDMEHAPTNPALMSEMVAAVASCGTCAPIVRVPSQASEWFKWALDAGAHGIIVPMVNTSEELRKAESLCRYPPAGKRSIGAFFAPGVFGMRGPRAMSDYVERVSNDILVIPQIESVEGAINLPNMLKEGGMDAVFVGPYDLNASVRYAQDMQIQDVLAHIEKSAKDAEVPLGIYAPSGAAVGSKVREGYTLVVAASDIECMASSALENLDRARSESRHHR